MIERKQMLSRGLLGLAVLGLACEPPGFPVDATETDMKLGGVGLNPEEIGPSPTMYGGVIEYDWVNFAGAGLPLGLMGLVSYDAVSGSLATFKPPYAMVYGLAFIMESDLPATDTLFGTFGLPNNVEGSCYTSFDSRAYLNNTADVGTSVDFMSEAGDFEFSVGRRPLVYAKNTSESLFAYYTDLGHWMSQPLTHLSDVGSGEFSEAEEQLLRPANWRHASAVNVSFPGGLPPEDSSVASIPVPLAAAGGDVSFMTPNRAEGVMMSWSGPVYDHQGNLAEGFDGTGTYSTCLQYLAHDESPIAVDDCLALQEPSTEMIDGSDPVINGQVYTGPWDTDDGIEFNWVPGDESVGDVVSISVRFLGPVDEDDKYKQIAAATVPPSDCNEDYCIEEAWEEAQALGYIDEDIDDIPDGFREAQSCEEEGVDYEWEFDTSLLQPNGDYLLSLQGEPSHTLSEVTCNVPDAGGTFTLTPEMVADAMDYAQRHGAGGAIFYFSRTTTKDLETPPVRDRFDQLRDASEVRLISSSVELGRFWWDQ